VWASISDRDVSINYERKRIGQAELCNYGGNASDQYLDIRLLFRAAIYFLTKNSEKSKYY